MVNIDVRHKRRRRGQREQRTEIAGQISAADGERAPAGTFQLHRLETVQLDSPQAGSYALGSVGSPGIRGNDLLLSIVDDAGSPQVGTLDSIHFTAYGD